MKRSSVYTRALGSPWRRALRHSQGWEKAESNYAPLNPRDPYRWALSHLSSNVYTKHEIKFHLTSLGMYLNLNISLAEKLQFSINLSSKSRVTHVCWRKTVQVEVLLTHIQRAQQRPSKRLESLMKLLQPTHLLITCSALVSFLGTGDTAVNTTDKNPCPCVANTLQFGKWNTYKKEPGETPWKL